MTRLDDLDYPIIIDTTIAPAVGRFLRERGRPRAVVRTDRNVADRAAAIAKAIGGNT
ncbi:MAG: hypothetical protein IAI50_01150, partial [Candidatus Eremiobacteraeota bacterium]|nr:hypothetical protein [Candidatus Eremiobacteraeota bacterium]